MPAKTTPATETPKETPRQKFIRLAESRVGRALHDLTLIGNLAGEGYESTDADAELIISTLRKRLDEVENRFKNPSSGETESFKLTTNGDTPTGESDES